MKPFKHQIETLKFLVSHERAFCWNDTGTGKTASCIWSYLYLRNRVKKIRKALIISPLSTVRNVWEHDFFKLAAYLNVGTLTGSKERRIKQLKNNYDCYVINHDGIKIIINELYEWQPELIIVDEHTAFKTLRTKRFKMLFYLCKGAKYVWFLSGTPAPQAPTDLYAPGRIICPDRVGRSFTRFRYTTMNQISQFIWRPKRDIDKIIKTTFKDYVVRFTRDDCLDLPNVTKMNYEIDLSKKQEDTYKKLRLEALAAFEEGEVTAVNEGVMRSKLLQCCGGYVYAIDKETNERIIIDLKPKERNQAILDLVNESPRGVLIFSPFKSSIAAVYKLLKTEAVVAVITGETSLDKRTEYFDSFQKGKIKVLIAHPRTMAHGVTLTYADTVIWHIVTSDNELYSQANARINRIGQEHKMRVIHLMSTALEKRVLQRLKEKQSTQGILLDVLKSEQIK